MPAAASRGSAATRAIATGRMNAGSSAIRLRSRSTGLIGLIYAAGGVIGLVVVGALSGAIGTIGPALATLAFAPVLLVILIVRAYPETAGQELEELNPEDRNAEDAVASPVS